jgi:hypothetical protein
MKQLDDVCAKNAPLRGLSPAFLTSVVLAATAASIFSMPANADEKDPNRVDDGKPIVLKTQGSFTAGSNRYRPISFRHSTQPVLYCAT